MKKFGQKFVFEQKFARKTLFPWEYYIDWDSNQVFWIGKLYLDRLASFQLKAGIHEGPVFKLFYTNICSSRIYMFISMQFTQSIT